MVVKFDSQRNLAASTCQCHKKKYSAINVTERINQPSIENAGYFIDLALRLLFIDLHFLIATIQIGVIVQVCYTRLLSV